MHAQDRRESKRVPRDRDHRRDDAHVGEASPVDLPFNLVIHIQPVGYKSSRRSWGKAYLSGGISLRYKSTYSLLLSNRGTASSTPSTHPESISNWPEETLSRG